MLANLRTDAEIEEWRRERGEVLALLKEMTRNKRLKPVDRLKAIDLYAKIKGFYPDKRSFQRVERVTVELSGELLQELKEREKFSQESGGVQRPRKGPSRGNSPH